MIEPENNRKLSYAGAIHEAIKQAMSEDHQVIVFGEGVPDPKGIFGTTAELSKKFGSNRVFDTPLSENAMTGAAIGLANAGFRPLLIHQRIDFALLSLDQIANNAAKWRYMFNEKAHAPIVVRMIIGRGWGQGPQHSQSLQMLFSIFHGLVVVMPATPSDAKGMLLAAFKQNDPVMFIEHRWLHNIVGNVPKEPYVAALVGQNILREGRDVTILAVSHMVPECLEVSIVLQKCMDINCEVVDLRVVRPLDLSVVKKSIQKTRRLVFVDTANEYSSIGYEIVTKIAASDAKLKLEDALIITCPPEPLPSSHFLADGFYPDALRISKNILKFLQISVSNEKMTEVDTCLRRSSPHDKPNSDFSGPF